MRFKVIDEKEAVKYLTWNTYFFKLKSYTKSFDKKKDGTFINLDFAYLVELSKLDAHLRRYLFDMTLSIEHLLKTTLIRDITINEKEDGYSFVHESFKKYPYISKNIETKKNDSACADLINKNHPNWSIWAFLEVLSFGDLIKIYSLYYSKYPTRKSKKSSISSGL